MVPNRYIYGVILADVFFYEPFYSLSDFDRLFDEAFTARAGEGQLQRGGRRNVGETGAGLFRPRMDVHEDAQSNTVTATFELPGLKKEDVQIDVHNNALTVSGETNVSSQRDENGYAVRERRSGRFSRTLPVPQGIKADEIKASMEHGILTVTFPKSSPEQAPKRIIIA